VSLASDSGFVQRWVVVSALCADSFEPQARHYSKFAHDYVLMGMDLRVDEEYAGVGG
jgi:hypothetical protein